MTSDIHIIYPSWSDSKHPTVTIAAKLLHLLQKTQPMPAARKVPYKISSEIVLEITKSIRIMIFTNRLILSIILA